MAVEEKVTFLPEGEDPIDFLNSAKGYIGLFITKVIAFVVFAVIVIVIGAVFGTGTAFISLAISIIIVVVVGLFMGSGFIAAMIKSMFEFIDLVPVDGIAKWILRIFVAGSQGWSYFAFHGGA